MKFSLCNCDDIFRIHRPPCQLIPSPRVWSSWERVWCVLWSRHLTSLSPMDVTIVSMTSLWGVLLTLSNVQASLCYTSRGTEITSTTVQVLILRWEVSSAPTQSDSSNLVYCQGMIAACRPEDSWVCRWQRISKFNKGVYAISVQGRLPPAIVSDLRRAGIVYKSRDTSKM